MDRGHEGKSKRARNYSRIRVKTRAIVKIEGSGTPRVFIAETRNMSCGGVCLQIDDNKEEILELVSVRMPSIKTSLNLRDDEDPAEYYAVKTSWINSKLCWLLTPSSEDVPLTVGFSFEGLDEGDAVKIDKFTKAFLDRKKESIFNQRIEKILMREKEKP
jgi:hypothetical protein